MKRASMKKILFVQSKLLIMIAILIVSVIQSAAQVSTEFTYQGKLTVSGAPASGTFDLRFTLEDVNGFSLGKPVELPGTTVTNGIFTVSLDFGTEFFDQNDRYLKIEVRHSSENPDDYTELAPLQKLTPAPTSFFSRNSLFAVESGNATNAQNSQDSQTLGGIAANGFIQNSTAQQSSANFSISGDGAAGGTLSGNVINTATQYNLGGSRILGSVGSSLYAGPNSGSSSTGTFNSFFGILTGSVNTTGNSNSFFGANAGFNNTTGNNNNFFGRLAGGSTTTGGSNAFYGSSSGFSNTTGSNNSYFGITAGFSNETSSSNSSFGYAAGFKNAGNANSFLGYNAGYNNTYGESNSFFGQNSGFNNTQGGNNIFIGGRAGINNTTGNANTFVGEQSGGNITTGNGNTFVGNLTYTNVGSISFSTAIGAGANVSTSNTIMLGTSSEKTIAAGTMRVVSIPLVASTRQVCANANGDLLQCGASSLRLKDNVQPYFGGLNLIKQFNPISFDWKDGSGYDIGLAAEAIAKIDPFFAFKNDKGEVQGVRYERLNILLINSVKEQQTQIETQQKIIERQQNRLDALTKLVCANNPQAEICAEVK